MAPANAQVSVADLGQVGLEVVWRSSLNQNADSGKPTSVSLYAHPTKRKQSITIVSNGRVVERISGDSVDRDAYEQLILKLDTNAEGGVKKIEPPRIGLEGARKQAATTEARLKILGRSSERIELDQEMVYMVAVTNDGHIHAMDAETGDLLWSTSVGRSDRPTRPAGLNDDFVAVINDDSLYVLRLSDGTTFNSRKLVGADANASLPVGPWVYVPGMSGTLFAYHIQDKDKIPVRFVSGGSSTDIPVVSLDRKFIAWNCEPKFMNLIKCDDKMPVPWNRFLGSENVRTHALPVQSGFVIATSDGAVVRLGLPTEANPSIRNDAVLWRANSGVFEPSTPIAANDKVYVWSISSGVVALDGNDGSILWSVSSPKVKQVLAVSKKSVYCKSNDDRLVMLDVNTGEVQAKLNKTIPDGIANRINDRIYITTPTGQIVCLHEEGASLPTSHQVYSAKPAGPAKTPPATQPSADGNENPFGAPANAAPQDPFGNAAAPASDPFGGNSADPFGGSAPAAGESKPAAEPKTDDPFGP